MQSKIISYKLHEKLIIVFKINQSVYYMLPITLDVQSYNNVARSVNRTEQWFEIEIESENNFPDVVINLSKRKEKFSAKIPQHISHDGQLELLIQ